MRAMNPRPLPLVPKLRYRRSSWQREKRRHPMFARPVREQRHKALRSPLNGARIPEILDVPAHKDERFAAYAEEFWAIGPTCGPSGQPSQDPRLTPLFAPPLAGPLRLLEV